jgi:hypothetical protein
MRKINTKLFKRLFLDTKRDVICPQISTKKPGENNQSCNNESCEFFLDQNSNIEIEGKNKNCNGPSWTPVIHCEDKRISLILSQGENLKIIEPIKIIKDLKLFIRYTAALPKINSDGLVCNIFFYEEYEPNTKSLICSFPISRGNQSPYWREITVDLSFLSNKKDRLS